MMNISRVFVTGMLALVAGGLLFTACKRETKVEEDKLLKAFDASQPTGAPPPVAETAPAAPAQEAVAPKQEGEPVPVPPPPPVDTKPIVQSAVNAIRSHNYESAVTNLTTLMRAPNLNANQRAAVLDTMADLQMKVIEAYQSGDPKAKQAAAALQKMIEQKQ